MGKYDELVGRLQRFSTQPIAHDAPAINRIAMDHAATAITTLEAELAEARNRHQATVVAAATHLMRAMNAEAELAEAKAEIERLADNGCHLEMLLAAMKARGARLAEALELVSQRCGPLATDGKFARQALTEWRDQ